MATAPSSSDIARAYCTSEDVKPYIAPSSIGAGAANPMTGDRVADIIQSYSRQIDGMLAGIGFFTPFPATGATNPDTPEPVKRWVMFRTAGELALIAAAGNRKTRQATMLFGMADEILRADPSTGELRGTLLADSFMEYVDSELLTGSTLDGGTQEFGEFGTTGLYRLRNRGLVMDAGHPLKFRKSNGAELFDSAGLPFAPGRYWKVVDAAQSTIAIWDNTYVEANAASVSYWFSWRDATWYQSEPATLTGVQGYAA